MLNRVATHYKKASTVRNGRAYCYNKVVNRVAPDESTPVAGGPLKIHQATSGIMSGIALMCESRKERSDGIAYCYGTAVNRVEFPFARANEGKHVRKGWLFT